MNLVQKGSSTGSAAGLNTNLKMGFTGGTLLSFIANISPDDILRTMLLTAMGATVSFGISLLLKQAVDWYKQHRQKP